MDCKNQNALKVWKSCSTSCNVRYFNYTDIKKKFTVMDWLDWHLLDQIATEPDQSLLIFSPFCSLVSLLMPAQCLLVCTRILKETWRNICLDWKKTESRGKAGQKLAVQKSSFKFPSNYWHDTRSMPAIFFAVSNLVQSSRYQAGMIWLQCSQSINRKVCELCLS